MDKRNSLGQTPLIVAVERKLINSNNSIDTIIQCLKEATTDVNATDMWGRTALMYAAQGCDSTIVELILLHGADGNLEDMYGETALIKACKSENLQTCTVLIQRGCKIFHRNRCGWSPISMARRLETLYNILRADPMLWLNRIDDLIAEIRPTAAAAATEESNNADPRHDDEDSSSPTT